MNAPDAPPFEVVLDVSGPAPVLRVAGDLDMATAPVLLAAIEQLPAEGADIRLDMSGVSFMDSSGLSVLVAAQNRGRQLSVVDPSPRVSEILVLTGMGEAFGATPLS